MKVILITICLVIIPVVSGFDRVEYVITPSITRNTSINPRYGGLPGVAGTSPNLRPSFFQLMNNIKEYTGSSPQFRIGGNSADYSWWNPNNLTFPPKVRYNIEPAELQTIHDVISKLDTLATLSFNFDNPTNATFAMEYAKAIELILIRYAVEIGNEVDMFPFNGYRDTAFNYSQYKSEFEYYVEQVSQYLPEKKYVQGATYCCEPDFLDFIPDYVASQVSVLKTLSLHSYPLTACHLPAVDLLQLLEDRSSIKQAKPFIPYIEATNAQGLDFWIGEMNSVSCGGTPNVSNVFGAALWAVDMMFNFVNVGVKGVNFHGGPTGWYSSFTFNSTETMVPTVRPLYYGQFMWAQAVRANSSLITGVHVINTTNELVKIWPLLDNTSKDLRIVVLHKDITTTQSANVTLHIDGASYSDNAEMIQLLAPSPYSEFGITLGNQTFDGSITGAPVGIQASTSFSGANNVFSVVIPPGSGAIISILATQN